MSGLWALISKLAMKHPMLMAGGTTMSRYVICDIFIQQSEIHNDEEGECVFDWRYVHTARAMRALLLFSLSSPLLSSLSRRRTAALGSFGLVYAAMPGYLLYNKLLPKYLPHRPFTAAVVDVAVYCPVLFYPLYYSFKVSPPRPTLAVNGLLYGGLWRNARLSAGPPRAPRRP
jgi:hypothetical protein